MIGVLLWLGVLFALYMGAMYGKNPWPAALLLLLLGAAFFVVGWWQDSLLTMLGGMFAFMTGVAVLYARTSDGSSGSA